MLLASLAGALAVAAASAVLLARGAGDRPLLGQSDSLARIDAETGAVTGIPAGNAPSGVAAGRSAVWVGNEAAGTLSSVDLRTGGVDEFQLGETPLSIAAYDRTIAVVSGPFQHLLTVVDEASRRVLGKVPLDLSAATTGFVAPARVAAGREGIWLLNVNEWALRRLELADGTPELSGPFPLSTPDEPAGTVAGISVGEGAVWVTGDADYRVLLQFDPATGRRVRRIELSFAPKRVAAGEGAVWVTDALEDYVWRVDAKTLEQTRIPVGGGPRSVAAGFGAVWVVSALGGSVSRIDPDTSTVASTVALGEGVEDVAVGAGGIWVTVDAG